MTEPRDEREPFSAASVARQLDYCTFCPKMCRHACPVSTASGRETYIPQVKMDRANQLRLGHAPFTGDAIANSGWASGGSGFGGGGSSGGGGGGGGGGSW